MRILLSILILLFSLQSLVWADDVKDFEIEGMSIGDSLLEYMEKKEIIEMVKDTDLEALSEEIGTDDKGFLLTEEQIYNLILGFLSIKAIQRKSIREARNFCITNKAIVLSMLKTYIEHIIKGAK